MATQLQIRRGTTAQMNAFTGAEGELAVNTTTDTVHVHDGSTAGGFALAKADGSNIGTYAGSFTTLAASGAVTLSSTLAVTGALTATGLTSSGPINLTAGALAAAGNAGLSHRSADNKVYLQAGTGGFNILDDQQNTHFFIDSAGVSSFNNNVGIGTSSPATKLAVSGGYISQTDGTRTLYLGSDGTGGLFGTTTNHYLRFVTNNAERMRIDSSGNVGVSVIPPAWGSAYANVNVGTAASFWGTKTGASLVAMSDNSYFNGSAYIARNTGAGSKYYQNAGAHYWDRAASVSAGATQTNVTGMTLDISGMLAVPQWHIQTTALGATAYIASGPQGGIYRSTSSIKYKRDVETIEDIYADALLDVRPVFYRSKSDNDNSAHGFWGIIAEELAEIDPRLVHWQTHVPVESTDDDGVVTTEMVELDTPEPEGVQYERFVPLLINLAKRQRDQITAQALAITDLTTRLTALENN